MSQLSNQDLLAMRGMDEQQRRDYISNKFATGRKAPPQKGYLPTSRAGGTRLGGKYATYVADSPLKHLANAFATGKNMKTMKGNQEAAQTAYDAQGEAAERMADALAGADLDQASTDGGFVHIGNGVFMDPVTKQEVSSQEWANRKKDTLEAMGNMVRPPASLVKSQAEGETNLNRLGDVITGLDQNPGAVNPWEDVPIDIARNMHSTFGNVMQEFLKSPEEQGVREQMAEIAYKIRRPDVGANYTEMEQRLGTQWDPSAPGISAETSRRRAVNLDSYIRDRWGSLDAYYGGSGQPGEAQPGAAPGATPPPGAAVGDNVMPEVNGTQQMIRGDGTVWEKRNGTWVKVR